MLARGHAVERRCAHCRVQTSAVLMHRAIPTWHMASEQQHVEVAVELRPGADRDAVANWLRRHALDAMPLVVGLLATGEATAVRAAFGAEPHGTLPVPDELRAHVASVAVVPPKRLHEGA
jgi:hypothetical protein